MEKERLGYLKLKKEHLLQKYGKEALISFISIFVLAIFLVGTSFAIFTDLDESSGHNAVTVGNLSVVFNDTDSGLGGEIALTNALPSTNAEGLSGTPYRFKITNNGNVPAIVTLLLQDDSAAISNCGCNNFLNNENVMYQLIDETHSITYGPAELTVGGELTKITLPAGSNNMNTYSLKVWIKEDADFVTIRGQHFHKKLVIASSQETPRLLTEVVIGDNESNVITSAATTSKAAVSQSFYDNMPTTLANYRTEVCSVGGEYYDYLACQECLSDDPEMDMMCESRFTNYVDRTNNYIAESGLYKTTGTNSNDTYFFRGKVSNNYVLFGGSTWKIVRINEDQTIRMMRTTSAFTSVWNTDMDAYEYLGYSYYEGGELVNSTIRTSLETWYSTNMMSYDSFVALGSYCNDLSEDEPWLPAAIARRDDGTPTYACSNEFTYSLKVGLLSADELVYAGFKSYIKNPNNFLNTGNNYYTMTPHGFPEPPAYIQIIKGSSIEEQPGSEISYVYPVINLVPTVKVTGVGTSTNPYVVTEK